MLNSGINRLEFSLDYKFSLFDDTSSPIGARMVGSELGSRTSIDLQRRVPHHFLGDHVLNPVFLASKSGGFRRRLEVAAGICPK